MGVLSPFKDASQAVKTDSKQRLKRTIQQGVAAVLVVVIPLLMTGIQGGLDHVNWSVLGVTVGTAALMSLFSFVQGVLKSPVEEVVDQKDDPEVDGPTGPTPVDGPVGPDELGDTTL